MCVCEFTCNMKYVFVLIPCFQPLHLLHVFVVVVVLLLMIITLIW